MSETRPLADVLAEHGVDVSTDDGRRLHSALLAREDNMADLIRLAGTQLGALPGFVAEVLAQVGLGTPLTPEQRQAVRASFERDVAWYRAAVEEHRRQHGED